MSIRNIFPLFSLPNLHLIVCSPHVSTSKPIPSISRSNNDQVTISIPSCFAWILRQMESRRWSKSWWKLTLDLAIGVAIRKNSLNAEKRLRYSVSSVGNLLNQEVFRLYHAECVCWLMASKLSISAVPAVQIRCAS